MMDSGKVAAMSFGKQGAKAAMGQEHKLRHYQAAFTSHAPYSDATALAR